MRFHISCLLAVFPVALVLSACDGGPSRTPPKDAAVTVMPVAETAPVADADDAADDPAIWVHPSDPARSAIIGTNKQRGLVVYDLQGNEVTKRDDGRMNNVDLRQNVMLGDEAIDLVAATNRDQKSIALYKFDGEQGQLAPLLSIPTGFQDPYGLCLYRNAADGSVYVFASDADVGTFGQWRITASGGALQAERVRTILMETQSEGCAVDDQNGVLFIAEEDVGLYAYHARPDGNEMERNSRSIIDTVAQGHLTADAEGVSLYDRADGGGYLIVSSQGSNSYNVYDRAAPYAFRGAFVIGPTEGNAIDGAEETDGLDVTAKAVGSHGEGLLVVQDGFNYAPGGNRKANQNFKLVPWSAIRTALKLPE